MSLAASTLIRRGRTPILSRATLVPQHSQVCDVDIGSHWANPVRHYLFWILCQYCDRLPSKLVPKILFASLPCPLKPSKVPQSSHRRCSVPQVHARSVPLRWHVSGSIRARVPFCCLPTYASKHASYRNCLIVSLRQAATLLFSLPLSRRNKLDTSLVNSRLIKTLC